MMTTSELTYEWGGHAQLVRINSICWCAESVLALALYIAIPTVLCHWLCMTGIYTTPSIIHLQLDVAPFACSGPTTPQLP